MKQLPITFTFIYLTMVVVMMVVGYKEYRIEAWGVLILANIWLSNLLKD